MLAPARERRGPAPLGRRYGGVVRTKTREHAARSGAERASAAPSSPGAGTLSVLLGAAFLMATSAIGPGFLTQTAVFTERLGASFAFAILVSVLFDLAAQLNVWRIIAASGRRAQDVANDVLPGLGHVLTIVVAARGPP